MAQTKSDRLDEIFRRLTASPAAADGDGARTLIEETINNVEDELSGIPRHPNPEVATVSDGRIYPPSDDYEKASPHSRIRIFRHRGHTTMIGAGGAIQIRDHGGTIKLDKPGADGVTVTNLLTEGDLDESHSTTTA